MATLQETLDAIKASYRSGINSTTIDGKTVQYDRKSMPRIIAELEAEIAGTPRIQTTITRFRK